MADRTSRTLVLTQGDPAGVGPELLLRMAAEGVVAAPDVVVADPDRLAALAASLPASWGRAGWRQIAPLLDGHSVGGLTQVQALARAVDVVLEDPRLALVTAPIDKKSAHAEGLGHPGHTEYLAARAGVSRVTMLMEGPLLRVALATVHLPLRAVPSMLQVDGIRAVATHLAQWLTGHHGISSPRIGILGLNPHAGERGMFGDEESRIIEPAMAELGADLGRFEGPLPADAAFFAHAQGDYDGLVAMYHDQALAPFKLLHFRDGVNVTLGLPFVRTSPDHGTAGDIAGQGIADAGSFKAAVRLARGGAR